MKFPKKADTLTTPHSSPDLTDFRWLNVAEWGPHVLGLLDNRISSDLVEVLKRHLEDPKAYVSASWVDAGLKSLRQDVDTSTQQMLAERFHLKFSHVIAFHSGRPKSVRSYFDHGIQIPTRDSLRKSAIDTLANAPGVQLEMVEGGISYMEEGINERAGELYLCLDHRELTEEASHYLMRGSEYVQGVFSWMRHHHGVPNESFLEQLGTPTLIEARIPIGHLREQQRFEIAHDALEALGLWLVDHEPVPFTPFHSFMFRNPIPPQWVANHTHPEEIPNALTCRGRERLVGPECDVCGWSGNQGKG